MNELLKDKNVKLLVAADMVMAGLTIWFTVIYPSWLNFLLILSGWTSLGALLLSNALVIRMAQYQIQIDRILKGRDANLILARLDDALTEIERITKSEEFQAVAKTLIKKVVM